MRIETDRVLNDRYAAVQERRLSQNDSVAVVGDDAFCNVQLELLVESRRALQFIFVHVDCSATVVRNVRPSNHMICWPKSFIHGNATSCIRDEFGIKNNRPRLVRLQVDCVGKTVGNRRVYDGGGSAYRPNSTGGPPTVRNRAPLNKAASAAGHGDCFVGRTAGCS